MEKRESLQRLSWWLVILVGLIFRLWWATCLACLVGVGVNVYLLRVREKEQPKFPCQLAIGIFLALIALNVVSLLFS